MHQLTSEDGWMQRARRGSVTGLPVLPATETRLAFLEHYAEALERRLGVPPGQARPLLSGRGTGLLRRAPLPRLGRPPAASPTRRNTRPAPTICLRLLGRELYSTYGLTADTGGLATQGAEVIGTATIGRGRRWTPSARAARPAPAARAECPTHRAAVSTADPIRESSIDLHQPYPIRVRQPHPAGGGHGRRVRYYVDVLGFHRSELE